MISIEERKAMERRAQRTGKDARNRAWRKARADERASRDRMLSFGVLFVAVPLLILLVIAFAVASMS